METVEWQTEEQEEEKSVLSWLLPLLPEWLWDGRLHSLALHCSLPPLLTAALCMSIATVVNIGGALVLTLASLVVCLAWLLPSLAVCCVLAVCIHLTRDFFSRIRLEDRSRSRKEQ